MEEANPWKRIEVPTSSSKPNSSRVDGDHVHNFWWAVNNNAQLGFFIQFNEEIELPSNIPKMAAMEARLSPNQKFMTLFLIDREIQKNLEFYAMI